MGGILVILPRGPCVEEDGPYPPQRARFLHGAARTPIRPMTAMRTTSIATACLQVLTLCACLENEEELVVHPDGSVDVTLRARGDVTDLGDGYALPLGGPWIPSSGDTERWLASIGTDTGSPRTRAALAVADWPIEAGEDRAKAELEVRGVFSRVEDLPRFFAPADEPYGTAYLARDTTLEIRNIGGRTVYVFERVYRGRDHGHLAALERAIESLPEDLQKRFENEEAISPSDWVVTTDAVANAYREVAENFVRDALLGLYLHGDASLDPRLVDLIGLRVAAAVAERIVPERLSSVYERQIAREQAGTEERGIAAPTGNAAPERSAAPDAEPDPFEAFEDELRGVLRATLQQELVSAGVAEPTLNAVLYSIEWGFTAFDHTTDLGDEDFKVSLTLPGVIVGGNHEGVDGSTVEWIFESQELFDKELVLRAISVLD